MTVCDTCHVTRESLQRTPTACCLQFCKRAHNRSHGRAAAVVAIKNAGGRMMYATASPEEPKNFRFTYDVTEATVWDIDNPSASAATTFCQAMVSCGGTYVVALWIALEETRQAAWKELDACAKYADLPRL